MNIFVSGLPFQTTGEQLAQLFAPYGTVSSGKIVTDRETGRSRGFGFVEMPDTAAATEAMKEMNGKMVEGRKLVVNEAHPKESNYRKNNFR